MSTALEYLLGVGLQSGFTDLGLTESLLNELSFRSSINRSLNKLNVTEDIVDIVTADAHAYETILMSKGLTVIGANTRVKTPDSIRRKVLRYPNLRFQSIFNDILGIRLRVPDYNLEYPEYFRVVDMTAGKKNDDGYRAVHLYYKKDNYHYPIEVQLWSEADYEFNSWSHAFGYKLAPADALKYCRDVYDMGLMKSASEYIETLWRYCNA